jgi:type 1 glutamine amidotransferase
LGRLLAITGGHRFDVDAFRAMLDDVCEALGWEWSHATQPAAQRWLRPEHAGVWDVVYLYDIPGLDLARGREPICHAPGDDVRAGVAGLLAAGQGIVAVHHALAGWPLWDDWAHVLGGRFLYAPGRLDGVAVPASGYRMASYRVDVVDPAHPVTRGVPSFEVSDELYLCPVFERDVVPLLATTADTSPGVMVDTHREVVTGEQHPAPPQPGSNLVGWARELDRSRLVYLLPGHGPSVMQLAAYRRLVANACRWAADAGNRGSP